MLDYTLLDFEEAVPFLGESRAPVAAVNAPPQRERHARNIIANRPHERNSHRKNERETSRMARDQSQERRPREPSAERARPPSRPHTFIKISWILSARALAILRRFDGSVYVDKLNDSTINYEPMRAKLTNHSTEYLRVA